MIKTKRINNLLAVSAFVTTLAAAPAFAQGGTSPAAPSPMVAPPAAKEMAVKTLDDAGITAKVKEAFAADSELKGLEIKVETMKGEVQLTGKVNTKAEEEKALALTKKVEGVKSVKNSLTINTPEKK